MPYCVPYIYIYIHIRYIIDIAFKVGLNILVAQLVSFQEYVNVFWKVVNKFQVFCQNISFLRLVLIQSTQFLQW